jgi:tRNA A-37 threonylcarbamoyl transferase component Bud32
VIIKRPRLKYRRRRITAAVRPSRARRIWTKAWKLLVRELPCEWPLLLMEKRSFGHVTDSLIVLEKMAGQPLSMLDLDSLGGSNREKLFHRLGRTLRKLERLGFTHFDAKATNWIIQNDPIHGPTPILIDVDGVRHYAWRGAGIERLLRSMKDHQQYTPADSLALCRGYAPRARLVQEHSAEGADDRISWDSIA